MSPGPDDTNGGQASTTDAPERASKHPRRTLKLNLGREVEAAAPPEPRRPEAPRAGQAGAPAPDPADRPALSPFRYPVNRYARRP
jgi:hypothetical protein